MKRFLIACVILLMLPGCSWPWAGVRTSPGKSEVSRLIEEKGPGETHKSRIYLKITPGQAPPRPTTRPAGGVENE